MSRSIILHFSTKSVSRTRDFYCALGFSVVTEMSGETHVCIKMGDTISVMFSEESTFLKFSPKGICDTSKYLEVLNCLTCVSRVEVDEFITKARAHGGTVFEEAEDHGFMYQHSFLDPDGHGWNLIYVDEAASSSK